MNRVVKNILAGAVALTAFTSSYAQRQGDVYRQNSTAKVLNQGNELQLAWSGGVNNPQFAMADLNRDGRNDLVIFESSMRGRVKTFASVTPGVYRYAPEFEANFPDNISGYIKLIDFNKDGIPDLIHRGFAGVNISFGYYSNNVLKFRFIKELYYYMNGSGWVNVSVNPIDIPIIEDIDRDGDVDILAYDVTGIAIQQYNNCTLEEGLPISDSIKVCVKDECWGKSMQMYERLLRIVWGDCFQTRTTCKNCPQEANKGTHGANTLTGIDMDGDGDWDFFNGNESYGDIQFLTNGKTQYGKDSVIAQDTLWGAGGKTMNVAHYPAAFHLNIDQVGGADLIFTPMQHNTENYNSVVYFQNTGTNGVNSFTYRGSNYLVDRMIDVGMGSYPIFYDYDKDGKEDLFVGSDGYYDPISGRNKSRISYYKNITAEEGKVQFEYVTDDFLGLSAKQWAGAALAIGDVDGDTLDDMIIGHTDGTLSFLKNVADSAAAQPDWQVTIDTIRDGRTGNVLDVGSYAAPCLYDISGDGRKDLICGNRTGDVIYIYNYGAVGTVGLQRKNDALGGVKIKFVSEPYAYTVPYIGVTDDSKTNYLVLGTQTGQIFRFAGVDNGENATYTQVDSVYSYINVGMRAAPAFANLDNDAVGLYELVVGNVLGGLQIYKQDYKVGIKEVSTSADFDVKVYPNPASGLVNINWDNEFADGDIAVQLISVTGQVVMQQVYNKNETAASITTDNFAGGVYYCVIQSGGNRVIKPVTILK